MSDIEKYLELEGNKMTNTTEELKQRALEVAELYAQVGCHEWYPVGNDVFFDAGDSQIKVASCSQYGDFPGDYSAFFAHAPAMAQLIADQQAKIKELEKLTQWRNIISLDHPNVDNKPLTLEGKKCIGIAQSNPVILTNGINIWKGTDMISLETRKQIPWAHPVPTHWMPLPTPPAEEAK